MVPSNASLDSPLFANDEQDLLTPLEEAPRWKVLVVDDEEDVVSVTRLVLASFKFEGRAIELLPARSAEQARKVLEQHSDIAVAFIDVVMESDNAGLELVRFIRDVQRNDEIQLILRTGQPGFAPELKVILEYGINDYRTKTELDNVKLLSCLVAGLRNYRYRVQARQAALREEVASELHEAKSLFFAQMSHDLRTPLNSILGFCQLLELSELGDEQLEQVRLIRDSGDHLLALVNDILDLSKGEAGKIELESIAFSLHSLVRDITTFLQPQVPAGVQFQSHIEHDVPDLVLGDPVRVRQILYNLLSNALKFTQQGAVSLQVALLDDAPAAGLNRIGITVTDTGPGIPQDRLPHLFSVYEQADASVSRSYGGTGLGLYISKQLAELMQGAIDVSSRLGKGSVFKVVICLPSARQEAPATVEPVATGVKQHFARVLVVDDDRVNCMLLRKMLARRGLETTCAESGAAALAAARQGRFDLVFMDCQMPGLSGMETTRRLRLLEHYARVPVIALTGNGEDDMAACFQAGMNDFMTKPVDLDGLNAMVAKWMGFRTMMK